MRKFAKGFCLLLLIAAVLTALLSWNQAKGMLEFSRGGKRTGPPDTLTFAEKLHVALFGVTLPRPENTIGPGHVGLGFETFRFPNGRGHTLDAWYIPAKRRAPLVLLFHGYGASKAFLLPLAEAFNELGCPVFMVDFYGSGDSTGRDTSVGYFEAVDVSASYGFVKKKWPGRALILYGYSMGGAALLRALSMDRLRPRGIVLESVFSRMLTVAHNRIQSLGLPDLFASRLFIFWAGVQQGFNGFRHNPSEYARQVTCPALILHGRRDNRVRRADADIILANLKGPKRLVLFPDAGHEFKLITDGALWRKEIKAQLALGSKQSGGGEE